MINISIDNTNTIISTHTLVDSMYSDMLKKAIEEKQIPMVCVSAENLFCHALGYLVRDEDIIVNDLLVKLLEKTNGDIGKAKNGVIFIDDMEELTFGSFNKHMVQSELVSIMSGERVPIKYHNQDYYFDTSDIIVIGTGNTKKMKELDLPLLCRVVFEIYPITEDVKERSMY